ncbi:expressed unknown protein [Ectocarpus siliculosus]|uniref:Uncharacterized protein n=1 Tax=Ectocarpus siliculosus TaxID=2880 RepID=D7FZD7_ECTSI|nr:expressed unknown protein [Ectocarpus siliculosus]|eukprot:CBJ32754.1 expressed unknown protein [Ectocarpus siliculosus]
MSFCTKLAVYILIGAIPILSVANDQRVSWDGWDEQSQSPDPTTNSPSVVDLDVDSSHGSEYRGGLHDLVRQCAERLDLPGYTCEKNSSSADFRIPLMGSGDLPCGFETRLPTSTFEDLASRYAIHFMGDSTSRRLVESFISIATGNRSAHVYYHESRNLTVDGLQVNFHWAPYCRQVKNESLHEIMDNQALDGGRRAIIVTAFGVWDSSHGGGDEAALGVCADAVRSLVQVAQPPPAGSTTAENIAASPPLVFLLQNNPFLPGSEQDLFLRDLHQIQREIVDSGEQEAVYLVHDRESIFNRLSCYRMSESIHFNDPVKLVEGKMLWDLIELVARADT